MTGAVAPPESPQSSRPGLVVRSWAQAPCVAVQFLTIVPPLVRRPLRPDDLGRSEAFFPLVGLALGSTLALADWLLTPLVAPRVLDVVLVGLLAALTGGLHLDGVIDTFDGLFSGATPERRLAIMRDPRAGSFGVVAVVLLIALKLAALASLPLALRTPALILAPCLGRWGIVLATGAFAYARPEGMGRDFKNALHWPHVVMAGLIALGAATVLGGTVGLLIWTGACTVVLLVGRWIGSRLGGLSGDIYGTICETTETGVLIAFGLHVGGLLQ